MPISCPWKLSNHAEENYIKKESDRRSSGRSKQRGVRTRTDFPFRLI